MALLPPPPPRAPLSSSELFRLASFVMYDRHTYLSLLGYVVSLQARSCNEMGFPLFFNNIHFSSLLLKKKFEEISSLRATMLIVIFG